MAKIKPLIAIIDDDLDFQDLFQGYLQEQGFRTQAFSTGEEFFQHHGDVIYKSKGIGRKRKSNLPSLVLCEVMLPGVNGIEFLQRLTRDSETKVPTILMTSSENVDYAIAAIRGGASDYFRKPFELPRLISSIRRTLELSRLEGENIELKKKLRQKETVGFVGKSASIQTIQSHVNRIAHVATNVLILGESGTGKEVLAKYIHNTCTRTEGPFIAVNSSAIPDNLLESELFGHVKGAFTGAESDKKGLFDEAEGGTLFLDEIGDMNIQLQAKILRVLQEKKIKPVGSTRTHKVDVRIIAATHQNLKQLISEQRFRSDLYYRLNVISFNIPPLRERKEDILPLAMHFLEKFKRDYKLNHIVGFDPNAIKLIESFPWYGNVRELENSIERAAIFCKTKHISANALPTPDLPENRDDLIKDITAGLPSLREVEGRYIQLVLSKTSGNKSNAAKILGLSPRTLYRRIEESNENMVPVYSLDSENQTL